METFNSGPATSLRPTPILVNVALIQEFEYKTLYRLVALAFRSGGALDLCNEDMAIFSFSTWGISNFIAALSIQFLIQKKTVSTKGGGHSKVNIRFAKT